MEMHAWVVHMIWIVIVIVTVIVRLRGERVSA
jgi:hypothetical protein